MQEQVPSNSNAQPEPAAAAATTANLALLDDDALFDDLGGDNDEDSDDLDGEFTFYFNAYMHTILFTRINVY